MGFYPYKPSEIRQDEIAKSIDKTERRSGHKFGERNGFATITLSMNRRAPPVSKANGKYFENWVVTRYVYAGSCSSK